MTVAAIEAKTLDTCLREQHNGSGNTQLANFPQRFQKAISRDIKTAWMLSAGEDLRYPGTEGRRSLDIRLFNWYIRRVIALAEYDPHMATAFFQIYHLLKPLRSLFVPHIMWAVLTRELSFRWQKPRKPQPPDMINAPVSQRPLDKVAR
jgi:hypothetical protein